MSAAAAAVAAVAAAPAPMPSTQLLTIDQTCERLQFGRTKIYQLIRRGQIKVTEVDGRKRISEGELARFVNAHTPKR